MMKANKQTADKKKKNQLLALEKLRKEYRIHFINDTAETNWPLGHRETFKAIRDLGEIKYDEYWTNNGETQQPWKVETKLLVKKLLGKAEQCSSRNEDSWRFSCENLVFDRFDAEVACPKCRMRVWRSAIEAPIDSSSRSGEHLRRRQKTRESCCCPTSTRPEDVDEVVGLNKLFIDRAGEYVIHDPELTKKLPKQSEQPDRVFGLRETRNLQNALYALDPEGKQVRELIEWSPYYESGFSILFPFLVVEAKSGKAACDWNEIKLQTAFPIFTFLQVQNSLRLATGGRSKWKSGPLVWFFMNKGEDWCVCAAYQSEDRLRQVSSISHDTNIIELWKGSITSRKDTLQLILIVDFICDWARDIYRRDISCELRILASPPGSDVRTIVTDTDINSLRGFYQAQYDDESLDQSLNEDLDIGAFDIMRDFHAQDSSHGVMRHAAALKSVFSALFIPRENIEIFTKYLPKATAKRICHQILTQIQERSLILFPKILDRIEEYWTGNERRTAPYDLYETEFFAVITCTFYLNSSWEQVRELSVIAIAKDAFTYLVKTYIKESNQRLFQYPPCLRPSDDLIMETVSHLKGGSIRQNLLAAISRITRRIENKTTIYPTGRLDLCVDDGETWKWVQKINKVVQKEVIPGMPIPHFLRISRRQDTQITDSFCKEPPDLPNDLKISPHGAVLVYGVGGPMWPVRKPDSPLCVYFVAKSLEVPDRRTLATIILDAFQNFDIYHTTRDNRVVPISKRHVEQFSWNIENTYGVYFSYGGESFQKWLQALGYALPTRQGSPRGSSDSGNFLTREYNPWQDPRLPMLKNMAPWRADFLRRLIEVECKAWRSIAQVRYEKCIVCCACCAAILDDLDTENHICGQCVKFRTTGMKYFSDIWKELDKALKMRKSLTLTAAALEEESIEYNIETTPLPPGIPLQKIKPLKVEECSKCEELY